MRTVKAGDKFKLGPWTWTVVKQDMTIQFHAISEGIHNEKRDIWLDVEDADTLDWINEPATISKEARDEIVEWYKCEKKASQSDFITNSDLEAKLDSMVRDGE